MSKRKQHPPPATAADHRDRRKKRRAAAEAAAAEAAEANAEAKATTAAFPSLLPAEALYSPLPKTGTVQEALAACAKRNPSSVFFSVSSSSSSISSSSSSSASLLLETALESLSRTTRRGAAGSEARGAALARVAEKALLLEDNLNAGLASGGHEKNREAAAVAAAIGNRKKPRKTASGGAHGRPRPSQLLAAAAVAPRPQRKARKKISQSNFKEALASAPREAVDALERRWKGYVRRLALSGNSQTSSAAALSALSLVGARVSRVAASSREGGSGLFVNSSSSSFVVVAESRKHWFLYEREGKVHVASKAGTELEVELMSEGEEGEDDEGEGEEDRCRRRRRIVAVRVGGGH